MGIIYGKRKPRNESGLPLGGIGAGKIEFGRDGRFTNITINNNWDCPIVDGSAKQPTIPHILEGFQGSILENSIRRQSIYSAEGVPGAWLAAYTPLDGAKVLKTHSRPAFICLNENEIDFEGRFPVAHVNYPKFKGISLELDAFSSFAVPDFSEDYHNSALPLALFVFRIRNNTTEVLPISLMMSWQNLNGIGGYAGYPINQFASIPPVFRNKSFGSGLWFAHDSKEQIDLRVVGNYSLRVWTDQSDAIVSYYAGWAPTDNGHDLWDLFSRAGELDNRHCKGTAGALAEKFSLKSEEKAIVVFSLAWYMPYLLAAETEWSHLVRPSSPPPPPTSTNRIDYGHAYNRWFRDSWEVSKYGLQKWHSILKKIHTWHETLINSSLPMRFVDALCNDLFPLYTCAWYTKDLKYAVNEAPSDMFGCMGTLDQRGTGNGAVACIFPQLNKAELALFAKDQIGDEHDPRHFGRHFNVQTGRFDLIINREGAILHDVGWDHLEGGRTGDAKWLSAHWPELTSIFVLQNYQHILWNGDKEWLDLQYPRIKKALYFQSRLDQDGDGVADLWGPGSCTYDTELYPYYGASSYITSLYLAALRVGTILAEKQNDKEFADWTRQQFQNAQRTMEEDLWDEELGYYHSWRDNNYKVWDGLLTEHPRLSKNSQISQLAGSFWAELLDLGELFDKKHRDRALAEIGKRNVDSVPGCPADEYRSDGSYSQSMIPNVIGYFAALAITAGQPDAGWRAVEKVYRVRYDLDGSPWDAPLQCSGEGNKFVQWGRWYLSNPASWYVLWALGGVHLDRIQGDIWVAPCWATQWGKILKSLPVYLPGFQAQVDAEYEDDLWQVSFRLRSLAGEPIKLNSLGTRLPSCISQGAQRIHKANSTNDCQILENGRIKFLRSICLKQPGDGFRICVSRVKKKDLQELEARLEIL